MPLYRYTLEDSIEADSPEDAAIKARDQIRSGKIAAVFLVEVNAGRVVVDTELANESVLRDDRKKIGPLVLRKSGPTGVLTSPVLAEFYDHDTMNSYTDIERVGDKMLRLRGFGPEAYYEWLNDDGTVTGELLAAITVLRDFGNEVSA
jgi:hypothetical protein